MICAARVRVSARSSHVHHRDTGHTEAIRGFGCLLLRQLTFAIRLQPARRRTQSPEKLSWFLLPLVCSAFLGVLPNRLLISSLPSQFSACSALHGVLSGRRVILPLLLLSSHPLVHAPSRLHNSLSGTSPPAILHSDLVMPRLLVRLSVCAALAAALARPAAAQGADPALAAALVQIKADNAWTLEQQRSICQIPAPPFKEQARGIEMSKRLAALGLRDVRTDAEGNVIAERPGSGSGPVVVLSAHLDTVFPEGTDVTVKMDGLKMKGPGIGDDCRGLAVILAVARALNAQKVRTRGTILFIATVGEEGPGDLRGVRALFRGPLKDRITHFISVDGTGMSVVHRGVGSHRYKVRFIGPGGHSYGAFGMPNPAHAMGRAIAKIADIQTPSSPKTTFNVGVLSGGTSVNSIPFEVAMEVDMRSESPSALDEVDAQIRRAIAAAVSEEKARWPASSAALDVRIDTIGIRAATETQTEQSPIVKVALDAAVALGAARPTPHPSSTDSNIPLAMNIPAITVGGGGVGTGAHSLGEAYDDGPQGWKGPQWVAMVVTTLAGLAGVVP